MQRPQGEEVGSDMGLPLEGRLSGRGAPEGDGGCWLQEDIFRPGVGLAADT